MLPELQAERQLLAIESASIPHMKETDRAGVIRGHIGRLQRRTTRGQTLGQALAGLGLRTTYIPKRKTKKKREVSVDGGGTRREPR